jgi:hypothetical protein
MLGDRLAVHPRQPGQQAPHERRHPPARLHPAEPAADAQHQLIEFPPPPIQVYAEASGHRAIFRCPHTIGSSGDGRITSTVALRAVTKCRWSTKRHWLIGGFISVGCEVTALCGVPTVIVVALAAHLYLPEFRVVGHHSSRRGMAV